MPTATTKPRKPSAKRGSRAKKPASFKAAADEARREHAEALRRLAKL